jgi:hypothetical protein
VYKCEFNEAKRIIERYHYSHNLPYQCAPLFAITEGSSPIIEGVAAYSIPLARMAPRDWLELRRLACVPGYNFKLSYFVSRTLKILKREGVPAILSYADPEHMHHGGIYQASNWIYVGPSIGGQPLFVTDIGEIVHPRTLYSRYGTQSIPKILSINPTWRTFHPIPKHRYIMPLNLRKKKALEIIKCEELPYPKPGDYMVPQRPEYKVNEEFSNLKEFM